MKKGCLPTSPKKSQRISSVKIIGREQSGTCSYSGDQKTLKIYISNNNLCTQTCKVYIYIYINILCRQKNHSYVIVKKSMQSKSVLMLTYTHARRPEESFIFVRTHRHYHCHYIFFSFAWLVGCLLRFKKRVKIRKGANCYLYYSVKSSKPRGSTRYRRIPREPKQRKCNTHCV